MTSFLWVIKLIISPFLNSSNENHSLCFWIFQNIDLFLNRIVNSWRHSGYWWTIFGELSVLEWIIWSKMSHLVIQNVKYFVIVILFVQRIKFNLQRILTSREFSERPGVSNTWQFTKNGPPSEKPSFFPKSYQNEQNRDKSSISAFNFDFSYPILTSGLESQYPCYNDLNSHTL